MLIVIMDDKIIKYAINKNSDNLDKLSVHKKFSNNLRDAIIKLIDDVDAIEFLLIHYHDFVDINETFKIDNNKREFTLCTYMLWYNVEKYNILELFLKYFDNIDFSYDNNYIIKILCENNKIKLINYIFNKFPYTCTRELVDEYFDSCYEKDIEMYFINNFGVEIMMNMNSDKIFESDDILSELKKYIDYGLFNVIDIHDIFNYFIYHTYSDINILKYFLQLDNTLRCGFDIYNFLYTHHDDKTFEYIIENYPDFFVDVDKNILLEESCKIHISHVKMVLKHFPEINVRDNKAALINAFDYNNYYIARYLIENYFFQD